MLMRLKSAPQSGNTYRDKCECARNAFARRVCETHLADVSCRKTYVRFRIRHSHNVHRSECIFAHTSTEYKRYLWQSIYYLQRIFHLARSLSEMRGTIGQHGKAATFLGVAIYSDGFIFEASRVHDRSSFYANNCVYTLVDPRHF